MLLGALISHLRLIQDDFLCSDPQDVFRNDSSRFKNHEEASLYTSNSRNKRLTEMERRGEKEVCSFYTYQDPYVING